jgi:hypothetical protein
MKIRLFNRDGANLGLEKGSYLEPHTYEWHLKVDDEHNWVLKYLRIIGDYPTKIEAVDPSGGPFISVGNTFEGDKYKIIEIISPTIFKIWEQ